MCGGVCLVLGSKWIQCLVDKCLSDFIATSSLISSCDLSSIECQWYDYLIHMCVQSFKGLTLDIKPSLLCTFLYAQTKRSLFLCTHTHTHTHTAPHRPHNSPTNSCWWRRLNSLVRLESTTEKQLQLTTSTSGARWGCEGVSHVGMGSEYVGGVVICLTVVNWCIQLGISLCFYLVSPSSLSHTHAHTHTHTHSTMIPVWSSIKDLWEYTWVYNVQYTFPRRSLVHPGID